MRDQDWDLGEPRGAARQRGNGWCREFDHGWAALNFNTGRRRKVTFHAPDGLQDASGGYVGGRVTLAPHEGVIYRRLP
jgi:hypothetical protein